MLTKQWCSAQGGGQAATSKSRMRVYASGRYCKTPIRFFMYQPDRSVKYPTVLLKGFSGCLVTGEDYASLKKSFVIFICTYDPFGEGRRVYTFENRCIEDTSIALGDEATKIILNAKGTVGEVSEELGNVLSYMDGSAPNSEYTRALDKAVEEIRSDEKWRREYMVLNEMIRSRERLAEHRRSVAQIRKFRGRFDADELADIYIIEPKAVKAILETIDTHPDWDDEQVAENVDFE